MDQIISHPDQITSEWLTQVLRRSGAIERGSVADCTIEADASTWAHWAKINVRYAAGTIGSQPPALRLKLGNGTFGDAEVRYYNTYYVDLPDAPLVPCYDAAYSAEQRRYHLLLHDLTATHRNNWKIPPTLTYSYALAEALATLHAHWWGADRLRQGGFDLDLRAAIGRYIDHIQPGRAPLIDLIHDKVDPAWIDALHDVFAHHPALMQRRATDIDGMTLTHGDVNPGNILSPRHGSDRTYLIDHQPFDWSLTTWLGVSDLTYATVHWWPTEQRREFEGPLLKHYHRCLIERGVTSYSWDQLVADYKLCAVQSLYVVVEWCVLPADRAEMRWVWWPQLHKAMTAFFDLDCTALWK